MKAPPSHISSWCRSTYRCLISSQMALHHDYKFCFAVNLMSARSAQCLIFKLTVACLLLVFSAQLHSFLVSLLRSLPVMLLDTTESTSELGWTTYPDTGVSREALGDSLLTCSRAEVFHGLNVAFRTLKNITTSCRICPSG